MSERKEQTCGRKKEKGIKWKSERKRKKETDRRIQQIEKGENLQQIKIKANLQQEERNERSKSVIEIKFEQY